MKNATSKIKFYNDYNLDPNYNGKTRVKEINVDFDDPHQLYNIIKKKQDYKMWQPDRKDKNRLIRALENIDSASN